MTSQGFSSGPDLFRPISDLSPTYSGFVPTMTSQGLSWGPDLFPTHSRPTLFQQCSGRISLCSNHDFTGSFLSPRPIPYHLFSLAQFWSFLDFSCFFRPVLLTRWPQPIIRIKKGNCKPLLGWKFAWLNPASEPFDRSLKPILG